MDYLLIGILIVGLFVLVVGDSLFAAPKEDFDKEAEDSRVDTIRNELEQQTSEDKLP